MKEMNNGRERGLSPASISPGEFPGPSDVVKDPLLREELVIEISERSLCPHGCAALRTSEQRPCFELSVSTYRGKVYFALKGVVTD